MIIACLNGEKNTKLNFKAKKKTQKEKKTMKHSTNKQQQQQND